MLEHPRQRERVRRTELRHRRVSARELRQHRPPHRVRQRAKRPVEGQRMVNHWVKYCTLHFPRQVSEANLVAVHSPADSV